MNIALLSYEYPPETGFGGIGTYSYYQARALVKLGHRVHVFAGSTRPGIFHSEHDGVRVTRIRKDGWLQRTLAPARALRYFWFQNRLENAYALYLAMRDAVEHEHFDIVEAPECGADAAAVSMLIKVPVALRFHSPARLIMETYDTPKGDRELTSFVEQIPIKRARLRTACSQFMANEAGSKMGVPMPIHVIPNGIDVQLFDRDEGIDVRECFSLPRDGITVLFASRMEKRKGIHIVGEIAVRVLTRHPNARFVLAGRDLFGYVDRHLLPMIRAKGLEDRVHVLGGLDLGQVRALLKYCDIFFLPSLWENCPYSCLEAMTAGSAIVSSDCGGMPELIADGKNGLLARSGDPDSFVRQIEELIESAALRERLGAEARLTVERRLTDVETARRSATLYMKTLAIQPTAPDGTLSDVVEETTGR